MINLEQFEVLQQAVLDDLITEEERKNLFRSFYFLPLVGQSSNKSGIGEVLPELSPQLHSQEQPETPEYSQPDQLSESPQ